MIDFSFTEEHLATAELMREFCAREVLPGIRDRDRAHEFDPDLLGKLGEAGFFGVTLPKRYGGAGQDYVSLGLICEESEYADTSTRVIFSVHVGLVMLPLLTWGSDDLKDRYLARLGAGERIGAFGLTEPNAGSDVVGIQSTADADGDGFILNGEKMWISLADVADTFLMVAWTDREKMKARDHSGMSAFLVEREMGGITTGSITGKLGVRAGNTGWISMSDVRVPKANMIGDPGDGFKIAMFCLEQGRFTVAAGATGLVKACLDASVQYAQTRHTFQQPIGNHQLVKEMIARMVAQYEAARLLWLRAAWLKNTGQPNTRETALAKWIACEHAEAAAADAVQVHGAYGFSDEYPVERFYRNAKGSSIYEGTREIQKLMQGDYALGLRNDKKRVKRLPTAAELAEG
ncbi:MAG: acyl-CoA dehydrogenase family protein [Candidatus Zixiibacteriota bacterium]